MRQLVLDGKEHLLRLTAIPFGEAATQFLTWVEGGYNGDSRNSYLRIRSSFSYAQVFFGKAIVSGITTGHVETSSPHWGQGKHHCLWMDRVAQFIASLDQTGYRDLYDFMRLMIQQGTRPEELLELREDDEDLLNVRVLIQSGKTEAARRVYSPQQRLRHQRSR